MKKILLLIGMALFGIGTQGWAQEITTENRVVGAFDKIAAEGMITLNLTQGNENKVSVETDSMWQKDVKVEVKNGTLMLLGSKNLEKYNVRSIVNVSYKKLKSLEFVSNKEKKPLRAAKLRFNNAVKGDSLNVRLEGLDLVKLEYDVKLLNLYVDGANSLRLRGKADKLQIKKNNVKVVEQNGAKKYSNGRRNNINIGLDGIGFGEAVVAIVALLGVFFAPFATLLLIVILILRARRSSQRRQIELYAKAMEMGKEVPADLFAKPKNSLLNKGIIWAMVGVGVMLFFGLASGEVGAAAMGAIPFCIGVAYLLIYFVGKKQNGNELR